MSEPSARKRKQAGATNHADIPAKKPKREDRPGREKRDKRDKKAKARDTEFHVVKASLVVSVPPVFASNPRIGVEEMLDSMIMRYIPALRGVVLSHSSLHFLTKKATIQDDCPFLVCHVGFDATVWSPHVGMKLVGKVNLCSPDHISVLLHRTFNVSIPRHHIPMDQWEFEYGPAVNDPEFGSDGHKPAEDVIEDDNDGTSERRHGDGGGKWVHKLTNEKLGGAEGFLEFTVIGLTVANEMLSLLGSVQHDPFSPEHVPETRPPTRTPQADSDIEDIESEGVGVRHEEDDEIESDEDTFEALGRKADEEAMARRQAEEAELARKRKGTTDKGGSGGRKRKKILP